MSKPSRSGAVLIYGAYGYTGELIVRRCVELGLRPVVSGRDSTALKVIAERYGLPFRSCPLIDPGALDEVLMGIGVVVHAAGPFIHTASPMVEACLRRGVHYLDITGEIDVFRLLHGYDAQARERGIMILPGAGFDVVPSDCLAMHLKDRMPGATHLDLAFASSGGPSRGTKLTAVEGLGRGGAVRVNGLLKAVPDAYDRRPIPFADRERWAVTIPWGDVYTAYLSTGIPNIRVYMAMPPKTIRMLRLSRWFGGLLRSSFVKDRMRRKVRAGRSGPGDDQRAKGYVELWGAVSDPKGRMMSSTLRVPNGYTLTAMTAVDIVRHILNGNLCTGFQTPSLVYGSDLISRCTGAEFSDHGTA